MVTRTVSATEVKNRLGAYLKLATEEGEAVIVENHRQPSAVIISFEEYQRLRDADALLSRQRRLEALDGLMKRQAELNSDLTEEAAEALVQRALDEDRVARRQLRMMEQGS